MHRPYPRSLASSIMSAVNMTKARIHPKSAHSTSSPLPNTLPHINPITGPPMDLYEDGYSDPVYQAKARILNHAIQDIGMGRYQWYLFVVTGFGWFADSVWPLLSGLILTPVVNEFHFNGPFLSLASNIGLLVGAVFWGLGCDIWGRRWSFNATLFIAGIFGLVSGGAPSFVALASLIAMVGVGVGGNLPVDSAVFLDFVPGSHQYLLTILSIWWCLGQLLSSLIAWPLIANYSCASASHCTRSDNMGWRYLLFTLGGITLSLWAVRFFIFTLLESPRFLSGIGRDADAIEVIHKLAKFNGKTSSLTLEELEAPDRAMPGKRSSSGERRNIISKNSKYDTGHIKALFATPKMAWSTSLLIAMWGLIGLASTLYNNFLPYLLSSRGAVFGDGSLYITYRNQVILSVIGVPAALLAGWAVELPYIGRKGTLAIASGLTGAFLFATTTARTSNQLLGWNCGYVFFSNIMYGVLYAISPEIFPAKDRGTGNGLTSTASRVFGVLAPVIALYANLATAAPVYIAGALVIFAGNLALLLPYEPRGKVSI
ncbi:major facilitator superfamily domain-containing protein [Suillus plorans]|uniref:Major facilitator superfamily domain-containing protein n=1 Tax=Suillus plorans TaxID=116603 RepID=A0A9P7DKD3_9AGAM|nr:major facilitator superfamily domain-containing protein [Suillus plorans]KAG1796976.1 major facilitator superfamily domain-containing protein [Suillus plorans]